MPVRGLKTMLQVEKPLPVESDDSGPLKTSHFKPIESFIGIIKRHVEVFGALIASSIALGLLYLYTTPPSYTAHAQMVIDDRRVQVLKQQSVIESAMIDAGMVNTKIEVLKSPNISSSVIKELHLTEDPEFVGRHAGFLGAAFALIANHLLPNESLSNEQLMQRAITAFEKRRTVSRVKQTYVLEIGFQSLEPAKAAQIANAIVDAYILDQLDSKYQATRRASGWLQDRINELRTQASAAEKAVVDFKRANNIVESGHGQLMHEERLSEVNSQLMLARASTAEAKARLDRIREVMKQDVPDASVADALHSEIIIRLRNQYLDYAARERVWEDRYGPNHMAALNLRMQMQELRHNITDEMKKIAESYKSDYEIAVAREQSLANSLASVVVDSQTTNQAQIKLRELESISQTYRTIYDNFLQRYMESVQQQSFPITEARLIGAATAPTSQSYPNTLDVLVKAIGGGVMLGFTAAYLLDVSDRAFRTRRQVENVLKTNCIAILPALKIENPQSTSKDEGGTPKMPRTVINCPDILRHVVDSPFSQFTEGLRTAKVVMDLNSVLKSNKVIGVTSTVPNEGKSTIASNFAHLIAHAGERVLLLDCDLRNPVLSRRLAPGSVRGLIDALGRRTELNDAVWTEPSTGLTFLPAGVTSNLLHTNHVLASGAMKAFIDRLRDVYDYVIVDLPPLTPVVDTRATTGFIDSYLYIVEWGRTKRDVVEDTLGEAPELYERLLGVLLNRADIGIMSRYEGYASRYPYRKQYSRYGYTE